MIERKKRVEYIEVDVESLAQELAKNDYENQMKQVPVEDHEITEMIQRSGQVYVEKDIASKWAALRFSLIEQYRNLVMEFARNKK